MLKSTFVVDGTPVDCVRMGLKVFNVDFDLVVSGINDGNNVGKKHYVFRNCRCCS